jgi:hypothetical protein
VQGDLRLQFISTMSEKVKVIIQLVVGNNHTSLRCSSEMAENDLLRYVYYSIQVDSLPKDLQLGNEINELVEVSQSSLLRCLT